MESTWNNCSQSMAKRSMICGHTSTTDHCTLSNGWLRWIWTSELLRKKTTSSSHGVCGENFHLIAQFEFFSNFLHPITELKWDHLARCKLMSASNVAVWDRWLSSWWQRDLLNRTKTSPLESLPITSSPDRCSRSLDSSTSTTHTGSQFLQPSRTFGGSTKAGKLWPPYVIRKQSYQSFKILTSVLS